jgi:hypothetical protein
VLRKPAVIGALVSLVTLGAGLAASPLAAQSAAAPAPTRSISVAGTDVSMYPAFDPLVTRYGVTTATDTAGAVTVTASTSDSSGQIWVDGQPVANNTADALTGLSGGDEISVFIKDSSGTTAYSLVYLPAGFPTLTATTTGSGVAPGDVFMTLTDFSGTTTSYETDVDQNGVPVHVTADAPPGVPSDFKVQPDGNYSVYRQTPTTGKTGGEVVELNGQYQQIGAYESADPVTNTDGHDSLLMPNGDKWMIATQPRGGGGADASDLDAIIQEQNSAGAVIFSWDSDVLPASQTVQPSGAADYAHINSIAVMQNGDILASFRHFSSVFEIATHAHDGFNPGDIVWELGGRTSSFTFDSADGSPDPNASPCAQHDASELPDGDILIFDDGSVSINSSPLLCVNESDPSGPAVARAATRLDQYALNTTTGVATLVRSFQVPGNLTGFAGSAQRLGNGDTLAGWGGGPHTLATEFTADGDVNWNLSDSAGLLSYRAFKYDAPDEISPVVNVASPAPGASYAFGQHVTSTFSCTDQGGSSLQTCGGAATEGGAISTSTPGTHHYVVTATDGAGNTTTVTRTYTVGLPPAHYQPDAQIRPDTTGAAYVGGNIYGGVSRQEIKQSVVRRGHVESIVRIENDGNRSDRIRLLGTASGPKFGVAYYVGSVNVTSRVVAGTYRTATLAIGGHINLRVKVAAASTAKVGSQRSVHVTATSVTATTAADHVATVVTAKR